MFDERLRKRWHLWWGPPSWRRPLELPDRLHRWIERRTFRDRRDPEAAWRCCRFWQRTLHNKWNAREFAQRHGCRVPALYWFGRRVSEMPLEALPEHFVVRPNFGFGRSGVYVMAAGVNLLTGIAHSRAELRRRLEETCGRVTAAPLLVEEFVRSEDGGYRLPLEYKCHVFGDTVAGVEVIERRVPNPTSRCTMFTPDWKPFDEPLYVSSWDSLESLDPPDCLDEMLTWARVLGEAYATYVRVDFYASQTGCVFGEFSSTPLRGNRHAPHLNEYFEMLWREKLGDMS